MSLFPQKETKKAKETYYPSYEILLTMRLKSQCANPTDPHANLGQPGASCSADTAFPGFPWPYEVTEH